MKSMPDIEVRFYFNSCEKRFDNYRPAHEVLDNYLTTGLHHYYNVSGDIIEGTITFISPEYYPHCLWVGKIIRMYDGGKEIGYAEVLRIFNKALEQKTD